MKNTTRLIGGGILVALVLLLSYGYGQYNDQRQAITLLTDKLTGSEQVAKQFKDQYGITHNILLVANESLRVAKAVNDSLLQSTAKRTGVKPKQMGDIVSFTATKTGYREFDVDNFLATLPVRGTHDTMHRIAYLPSDCSIDIKYNRYWHRSWFLGHKKWFIDVYSDDKSVSITNLRALHIADEYSPVSIGVTLGVSVPSLRPALVIGICYTPDFLRFKKR